MKKIASWLGVPMFLLCTSTHLNAQTHNIQWATRGGGMDTDDTYGVNHDNSGNVYTTGGFEGTAQFGTTTLTSAGGRDMHISKLDASGNYIWTIQGAGSNGSERGMAIATDASGNSYVTGYFSTSMTIGTQTVTASGYDNFVAKIDPSGTCLWVTNFGATNDEWAYDIEVDNLGNIYITGYVNGAGHFGSITTSSVGGNDIFVTKLDNSGNFLWANVEGGSQGEYGYGIDVDASGNVYVTGGYRGTCTIASQSLTSTSSSIIDIFVAKYNASGVGQWANGYGDNISSDYGRGLAVDGNGDVYITGYYAGTINFGATTLTSDTAMYTSSTPSIDAFIAKFDGNGTNLWARSAGEGRDDYGIDIDTDGANNVYYTGYTEGDMIFSLGNSNEYRLYNTNDQSWSAYEDVFVACYTATGDFAWAKGGGDGYSDRGYAISVDNSSNVFVGGRVYETGSASFSGMSPTGPSNTDVDDSFILKYVPQTNIQYNTTSIDCYGNNNGSIDITPVFGTGPYTFSWTGPSGFTATTEDISSLAPGTYTVTVTDNPTSNSSVESIIVLSPTQVVASPGTIWNASSCDASDGSAHVIGSGGTLIVGPAPYIYTWSSSSSNSQLVNNLSPGVHSVVITDANGCSDSTSMIVGPETIAGTLSGDTTICINESTGLMSLLGNTGDVQLWQVRSNSGNWTNIANTDTSYSEILSTPGTYEYRTIVQCGDNVGDTSNVVTVIVEGCAGIHSNESTQFSMYPNPSNGQVTIKGEDIKALEIYDMTGKMVYQTNEAFEEKTINLHLIKGIYVVKIYSSETFVSRKLIIN